MVSHIATSLLLVAAIAFPATADAAPAQVSLRAPLPGFTGHPYPVGQPILQFKRKAGKSSSESASKPGHGSASFKVMVITDTHLLDDQTVPGNASNVARASTKAVQTFVKQERPDFVVHLGDLVSGEAANDTEQVRHAVRQILSPMVERGVPFSTVKGNHDNDKYSTHGAITDIEKQFAPRLSYTRKAPNGVGGGEVGTDNYWVPIFGPGPVDAQKTAPKLLLWSFDSRAGKQLKAQGNGPIDDWVDQTVAAWIQEETDKMEKAWGRVPPGLLFVHIPIHEHYTTQNQAPYADHVGGVADERPENYTSEKLAYPGLNDDKPVATQGQESDSDIYVDQDRAFLNAFVQSPAGRSRVHGITSGHDHGADWCAPSSLKTGSGQIVPVCFAKHSGYGGYDYDNWNHGARLFNFNETNVESGVETYIRFETGETRYETELSDAWANQVPS